MRHLAGLAAFLIFGATAFGADGEKVNLNTATAEELDALPHVGKFTAEKIIQMRPIKSLDDLRSIKGMQPEEVEDLKNLVTLGDGKDNVANPVPAAMETTTAEATPVPATTPAPASMQPARLTTVTTKKPVVVPLYANGSKIGQTSLPPGSKLAVVSQTAESVTVRHGNGGTITLAAADIVEPLLVATTVAASTPAPIAQSAPSPAAVTVPNEIGKKVLFLTFDGLDQGDRALIEGLRAKGVTVLLGTGDGTPISDKEITYPDPEKSDKTTKNLGTKNPRDIVFGNAKSRRDPGCRQWDDSMISEFDGFIFENAGGGANLVPVQKILDSGKLVVLGEARSVKDGEDLLLGTYKTRRGTVKPYGCETGFKRVAYHIYAHTWEKGMKMPTDADTMTFVEKDLIPKIKSGL